MNDLELSLGDRVQIDNSPHSSWASVTEAHSHSATVRHDGGQIASYWSSRILDVQPRRRS